MKQLNIFSKTLKEVTTYVGNTYMRPGDIRWSLENLEVFMVPKPVIDVLNPAATTAFELRVFYKEVDNYLYRKLMLQENVKKTYFLIMGQCTPYMEADLEALANWGKL